MKILMLGQNDPAGMMIAFRNALHAYTDHTVRVISMRTVYGHDYEYDIELPRLVQGESEDFSEVEHLLKTSDIFHFHMLLDEDYQLGPLLIRDYIKGKGLLYHHHGTYDHQMFLGKAEQYAEMYRQTGKRAIVSTPDLLKLLPEVSTWQPNLVPLKSELLQPRFDHLTDDAPVRIIQSPTRLWHKHTAEFKRATERVQRDFPNLERLIVRGKPYNETLALKRDCHMCFDHMNGWFGIASLESLALGHPTLAGLDDWTIEHIRRFTGCDENPWVLTRTEDELESEIRRLLQDPDLRLSIGKESRSFMENHWTEEQALAPLLETYQTL